MLKVYFRALIFFIAVYTLSFAYATSDVTISSSDYFVSGKSNLYQIVVENDWEGVINLSLEREIYENGEIIYQKSRAYLIDDDIIITYHWVPYSGGEFLLCLNATSNSDTWNYLTCKNITVEGNTQNENDFEGDYPDNILNGSCDLDVKVTTKKYIYNSSEALGIKIIVDDINPHGGTHQFTLAYWIEDLFGNMVKSRYENTYNMSLSVVRSYNPSAPKIADSEAYVIKAEVVDAGCNDAHGGNNRNETMIIVKGNGPDATGENGESSLKIVNVNPEETCFGDAVDVNIDVFRGDTTKYSISLWIERSDDGFDVSEKSVVYVKNKNTGYNLKIPVQIKPNCNGRYKDDVYTVIAEGLGIRDFTDIKLTGTTAAMCKTETGAVNKDENEPDDDIKEGKMTGEETAQLHDVEYEFISSPDYVFVGMPFITMVQIRNNRDSALNLSLYSYVISGMSRLSEGLSSSGWVKSWTGNMKEIYIENGDSSIVNLSNRIMKNVTGNFTLKVKIIGDVNKELEKMVSVDEIEENYDSLKVFCNATEMKAYLFLVNNGDELNITVRSYGNPQSKTDVVLNTGEEKRIIYFGDVSEFSVEYDEGSISCKPRKDEDMTGDRDENVASAIRGNTSLGNSFIGRIIDRILSLFGR